MKNTSVYPVLTIIIPYRLFSGRKVSSLIKISPSSEVFLWLLLDWHLAIYLTLSQTVVSKYFSKKMQCSAQEEICYMEFSHSIAKIGIRSCEWAKNSFPVRWNRHAMVPLLHENREDFQRDSKLGAEPKALLCMCSKSFSLPLRDTHEKCHWWWLCRLKSTNEQSKAGISQFECRMRDHEKEVLRMY